MKNNSPATLFKRDGPLPFRHSCRHGVLPVSHAVGSVAGLSLVCAMLPFGTLPEDAAAQLKRLSSGSYAYPEGGAE